jgi:hypothetical protein
MLMLIKRRLKMKDKAIEKITKEAMELNDPFAFFIEEHLTEMCTSNAVAEKLLAADKSIKQISNKIRSQMEKEAKEANPGKRSAWWGAPDAVLLKMVDEYYGLNQKTAPAKETTERVNVLDLF